MRRMCGHYIGYVHLSLRHRPNTSLNTVSWICSPGKARGKAAWNVGHPRQDVQDGRGASRPISGHHSNRSGCCSLREFLVSMCWGGMANFDQVGLNFMVYESIRKYFTTPGETAPPWYRKLAAGAISGAVAQTCTYPL